MGKTEENIDDCGTTTTSTLRSPKRPKLEENGLTLSDPDLLDCPICFDPLTIPVYQCSNGHFACLSCCEKIRDKCPSCNRKIGQIRCRGMEKIIESLKIPCRNMQHGCLEEISYSKKLEHEKACIFNLVSCVNVGQSCMERVRFINKLDHEKMCKYTPVSCVNMKHGCPEKITRLMKLDHEKTCKYTPVSCVNEKHGCLEKVSSLMKLDHEKTCKYTPITCPAPYCKYIGMFNGLYLHYIGKHPLSSRPVTLNTPRLFCMRDDEERILLRESEEKILFVLTRVVDPLGSFVNVTCLAPAVSPMKFAYDLTVTKGENSVSLKSSMELTQQCSQLPPKEKCLLIRDDFHVIKDRFKTLYVELIIRKVS